MTRRPDVLEAVVAHGHDSPVVSTTGYTCREAFAAGDAPNHLYMTGSMGMASVIGVGIARRTHRTTVVVDGDGAFLMNPGALMVVKQYGPENLLHLVLDNGGYESTGGQESSSALFDIPLMAMAMGYRACTRIEDPADLRRRLPELVRTPRGPHLVYVPTEPAPAGSSPRIAVDPAANFLRFRDWMTGPRKVEV
ncbi:thiamine pyrophosphate-dependent enzyme [Streptomyces sp. 11x1]|uniref:thiamine pyrophosphate-dependent enzyme n=1 Tax=Streptomyces sp. 11x1 TaxID=3038642 RepID=UPI00292CE009|nr:thiamine pyrophosphate-dependent enzyme [Streptomyces sp. 11x1]WNZ13649.1 thiamine pyrophosphate-dependent enzyme [Streptomyces sp. 11x1]